MTLALYRPWSRWLHWLFEGSLVIKGLLAASEALSGLGLLLAPYALLLRFIDWMTRNDITHEPTDWFEAWMQHQFSGFSIQMQHFFALYLLFHGGLKLAMVLGLARRIKWAYPASMLVLAGFVAWQIHHFSVNGSPMLIALSMLDTVMIALVWREYRLFDITA